MFALSSCRFSIAAGTVALCVLLLFDGVAFAHDCADRILNFKGMLQLPSAVLEDCMRTSHIQAIVTTVLGGIAGVWIAGQIVKQMGQPPPGGELPSVSRKALIDLVDQIERSAAKQGYHEGLQERIEGALDEVQAEIDKLARMDPNSNEARLLNARLSALLWGLNQTLNPKNTYKRDVISPALPNSVSAFPAGDKFYKCNKFGADCYAHGAGLGLSHDKGQTGYPVYPPDGASIWPPQANDIARLKSNLRNFSDARDYNAPGTPGVDSRSIPRPGDLVAYPARRGSGHLTIYVGNGVVIGAKTDEGATFETLAAEQDGHDGNARVRQYTGTGR